MYRQVEVCIKTILRPKFVLIFGFLFMFSTISVASDKSCKVLLSGLQGLVNPAVKIELAKYNDFTGDKEFSKNYNRLLQLAKKDPLSLVEKDITNIQSLIVKLRNKYNELTLDLVNKPEAAKENLVVKQSNTERLSLENFESETMFYVPNVNGSKVAVIFSDKLITKIQRGNIAYLEAMIKQAERGVITDGVGILHLRSGNSDFDIYEIRSAGRVFGGYRTYGFKTDELYNGYPVIRFYTYLKEHILGAGQVGKKILPLIDAELLIE